MANNRSRKLLDLAHLIHECTNCGRWVGTEGMPDGCEPAHENGISAGKGQSIKGQDNRHAALCGECHRWFDSGRTNSPCGFYRGTREDKYEMWNRAHKRTFDIYWKNGWLKVTA